MFSYKDISQIEAIEIERKLAQGSFHGDSFAYNSVHIGEDFMILCSKNGRFIDINFDEPFSTSITDSFFTEEQLKQVEYFYPREVYL